jgi:uncharacterized cupredoxin-like copper-binding protein
VIVMGIGAKPGGRRESGKCPITTRRGFIAGASFGAVSLYGLWVAYGGAPFGLDVLQSEPHGGEHDAGHASQSAPSEHAGHGATAGPSPEEFQRQAEDFIARHRLADGSVQADSGPGAMAGGAMAGHFDAGGGQQQMPGHDAAAMSAHVSKATQPGGEPVDIYLLAQQWSFEPSVLRLKAGSSYRLRMMAVDVSHGASLQLGRASQIIRLRPGIVVDRTVTFTQQGEYLLYCTVYCGLAHDQMSAKLIVA